MPIRVVLADDHRVVLDGLAALLARDPELRVEACCTSGEDAVQAALATRPDVVVLDVAMPGIDGIEAARQIRAEAPECRIVLLTAEIDEEQMLEAMRLGVEGVVLKEMAAQLVVRCIHKVHAGGRWVETRAIGRAIDRLLQREAAVRDIASRLSTREQDVLRLVIEGLTNRDIAQRLFLAEGTVKLYLHKIYDKLKVKGRMELAAYARERGFA
jgi:DNA-binding NarL/FixJ family response regulator